MNLGQIYDAICQRMWGESTPPTNAATLLKGEEGILANIHRQLQEQYDFYFMQGTATINTVAGQSGYNLPYDFKKPISMLFKQYGEERFLEPLVPVGLGEAPGHYWQSDSRVEYPSMYEIVDKSIILYPNPLEDNRVLHLVYWSYLDRPTDAGFDTHEDELTIHGAEVLINMGMVEIADIMKEWDTSQRYEVKAARAIESLLSRDRALRQDHISEVQYKDF